MDKTFLNPKAGKNLGTTNTHIESQQMGGTFRQKMSFPKKASQSNNRTDLGLKFCYLQICLSVPHSYATINLPELN